MNVSVGQRWEDFIEEVVKEGRYGSASEVVREGLRLVEEREAQLKSLRETIEGSLADPRRFTADEVRDYVRKSVAERRQSKSAVE